MAKGKEAGRIQVYVRVRPFTDKEKEKKEPNAIALHHDHSLIRVLDPRRETNYFFDGVFGPEASNQELYLKVGRPLVYAALNGYKGTLLTYGQTGTGKTYTLLSEDGVTTNVVGHCFERIHDDEIHSYKVTCSFLQVYQEKVYDLLNTRFTVELPVREHPKKGVYVANLTQNEVKSANDVLALLEYGKRQLVMAETKMVRHSSRSHSIMQLIIERRLKAHIAMEQASTEDLGPKSPENVLDSIMAVDETINNLLKELKQERKSHHRRERECLKELMEKELDESHSFKGDVIVKGKINLCDLAGSERLTKTKAEGVRLTEAKYLNTSLLELGNVIHALARGKQRHIPYRNSTLTRLLQDCLGDNGKTNFIVCIAPSLSEVNETKCSLNFGLRAMRIINVARLNVEMDYKVLAERLAKKLEDQDHRHKLEKLEYLREIQRLNTAVTSYEESEHVVNSDTDTLVSVIQNLSKSVQREKEAKHNLQSELTCLKKKVSNSPTATAPDIEALFLAELMSMQLLTHVYQSEAVFNAVSQSDLPSKVREYMTSTYSQENMLLNTGYMLQLLDSCLGFGEQEDNDSKTHNKEHPSKIPKPEQSANDPLKEEHSSTKKHSSYVQNMTGGLKKMFGLLVGNKDVAKTELCSTKSQHAGATAPENISQGSSGIEGVENSRHLSDTKQTMNKLVHTKENVEKHVANLLQTAFGEQLICSQGNSPQWGVLGRKLSELIMFKRNNIIGIKDTEMWSNYENVANILESCFKYVLIDKALLASMIVIEHMDGRGSTHKHLHRLASPGRALRLKTFQENIEVIQKSVTKEMDSRVTKESGKCQGTYDEQDNLEKNVNSMTSVSPNEQRVKGSKTNIEQEINDVFDDTSRLETELFATMEEKTRLEDELIAMKEYVNRLKSDMFHLKIERANLESDFKKTAKSIISLSETASNVPQKEHFNNAQLEDYNGLRVGELSDVTEASHESTSGGESENGSHVSEGNEQGSQVLKNCLASMAQMYSLMPNPDDDTLTEGDDSDGKANASLSEDDIADSDEDDIIITKIAREMQDYHAPSSSQKVKKDSGLSEDQTKKSLKNEKVDLHTKTDTNSTKGMNSLANALKGALDVQRPNKTLTSLQIAYEDIEDELYHVRGQLSKAQQIILSLESQITEEKANWEQIRKLYLENKDENDVLEGKVAILREELEKSLRENTFLKDYHKVEVVEEGQNKTHSNSIKSPLKSPSRRKVFDLRSIPSIQNSNREMQIIKLLEENTELRTKNEKLSEEKILAEHHSREKELKSREMEEAVRYIEEEKRSLKEEIEALRRRKEKLGNELIERREESVISSTELDLYSKESVRLEKGLAMERNMAAKLRNDNSRLTKNLERLELELDSLRRKEIARKQDKDSVLTKECGVTPVKTDERDKTEVLQMVFIDDSYSEEEERRKREFNKTDSLKNNEVKTIAKLQREIRSMAEYHEALEKEYAEIRDGATKLRCDSQTKEEYIKSLENEIENLRKQGNTTKTPGDHPKNIFSRLHIRTSPSKTKSPKEEFDSEGSIYERDYKNIDDEIYNLKRENNELRQQISNSEQNITIYEADLEKAMLKIKQLQEARVNRRLPGTDSVDKHIDTNYTPKEVNDLENRSVGAENYSIGTEIKLTKASEEIERLREQLLDKEAEKRLLYDELHLIRLRKDELDKALDKAREARTELQETMDEMAKCNHFEDTVKELTEKNQQLDIKLQQSEETAQSAIEKYEKQNEVIKKLEEELICASAENLKSEFEMRNAVIEVEKARVDLQQSKQDLKMIKIELNEKIERSTNLEIQLLELKCSNECIKSEVDQLKGKKRIENHQNQEKTICKETMEKRLHEAFVTNNQLQSEFHNILEENKDLNEKLCNALECKDNAQEEAGGLQEKLLHLQAELNQTMSDKKQLEGKVKKLDDTKRKMEEDLKRVRENTNILQSDLGKIEKQQEEANKKCVNLEKEIKRKTKELEGKQRDNRRLRKELISVKDETNFENESTDNQSRHSDEVKKLKAKIELLEKENDLHNRQIGRDIESNKKDHSHRQVGSGSELANPNKIVTFSIKDQSGVLNTTTYNEIGWDFENDTMAQGMLDDANSTLNPDKKEQNENEPLTREDLSEEVGWDLNDVNTNDDPYSQANQGSQINFEGHRDFNPSNYFQDIKVDIQDSNEKIASTSRASVTQITKEKLLLESNTARLLESKTSHLTKNQMSLEQSLSKALGENKRLLNKLNDSRVILERIKSRVSKLEEQNYVSLNGIEAETQTTHIAELFSKATQIDAELVNGKNVLVTPEMAEKENENATSPTKFEVNASSSKAILYLTREKKQVAKELEVITQNHEDVKKELIEQEKVSLKLKQELKTQKRLYNEEKKSLLKDLEIMRDDYNTLKIKLKEQEEHTLSFDELKEKQIQAEKLIFELEKDLMRHTEEKTFLKGKLSDCENKIKELETIEKQLQTLTNENIQMSAVQETMVKQIESYRNENKERLERFEKRKKSWNTRNKKGLESSGAVDRKKLKVQETHKRVSTQRNHIQGASFESISSEETEDSDDNDEKNKINECEDKQTGDKQNESFEDTSQEKQTGTADVLGNYHDEKGIENKELNTGEILAYGHKDDTNLKELNENAKENTKQVIQSNQESLEEHADDNFTISDNAQILLDDTKKDDGLHDNCTVRDNIGSDEETEEEANIELKLSNILKERHLMEHEIQSMIQEMNHLKAKFSNRQSEKEEHTNKQDELGKKLEKLLDEKSKSDEQVNTLKTINTKNEIELSDALDEKQAMEEEIMKMRTASQEHQEKIEKLHKNYTKLESVLAIVVEENSNLYKDVSTLREENRMLKNYNIREIVDGSTQVSPRTTEDEDDSENICSSKNLKKSLKINETPVKVSTSEYQNPPGSLCDESGKTLSFSKALLGLPIQSGGYLAKYPCTTEVTIEPLSASSPDITGTVANDAPNTADHNSVPSCNNFMTGETRLHSQEQRDYTKDRVYLATMPESNGGNLICSQCHKNDCQSQINLEGATNQNAQNSFLGNPTFESAGNDHDLTGGELCTDSSFASMTDFEDISFSSDWVSAEDLRCGRATSRGHRGINNMHREIAEIKCTNTILENELSIMKNRNSDFQTQLQKLAGKNNSLKQKICDRSLAIKKAEREMAVLTEEKMRFEVQLSASNDEITRLERDRSKLERSLLSSKSDNKRLKNDLATARADSYKTMKTLVNLEAEIKKLETELEETREELKNNRQITASMNSSPIMSVEKHQSHTEKGIVSCNDSTCNDSFPNDRAAPSLQLTNSKPGHVKRVANEQLFTRYHNKRRDFISSSESDNLSSPEDYPQQERKSQRLPCKSKSLLTVEGDENKAYTQTLSLTQSDDSESSRSETSLKLDPTSRTGSQMSYSSDLGFPGDKNQDSNHSDGGTGGSGEQDDKKVPQGGIKKMFKRFSKSKKTTKSSSS